MREALQSLDGWMKDDDEFPAHPLILQKAPLIKFKFVLFTILLSQYSSRVTIF